MHVCASCCGLITLLTHVSDATLLLVSETPEQTSTTEEKKKQFQGTVGCKEKKKSVEHQATENEY